MGILEADTITQVEMKDKIQKEPFLKWTRDELKQMDQRTKKLMTMLKVLHPRDDVDRLYVPRKEGGR